jgi:hypothetical protein
MPLCWMIKQINQWWKLQKTEIPKPEKWIFRKVRLNQTQAYTLNKNQCLEDYRSWKPESVKVMFNLLFIKPH